MYKYDLSEHSTASGHKSTYQSVAAGSLCMIVPGGFFRIVKK